MRKRLRLMGGNLGHGSPLDVLLALSRAIPPGMPVQVGDLVIDDSGLKIEGTADSFATVDQVKKALERTPEFEQIQVDHATTGSDPNKVEFRLERGLARKHAGSRIGYGAEFQGDARKVMNAMGERMRAIVNAPPVQRIVARVEAMASREAERIARFAAPWWSAAHGWYSKREQREKVLLRVLGAVLGVIVLYNFVYVPIRGPGWRLWRSGGDARAAIGRCAIDDAILRPVEDGARCDRKAHGAARISRSSR